MEAQLGYDFDPFLDDASYDTQGNVQIPSSCEEVAAPKKRRQVTTNRGGNFSIEEDKSLVSAWLNTSIDAVQGTDQKAKTFWQRISTTYNETRGPNHIVRTERSLSSRWSAIQLAVNKFCGFLTQVEASRPSGATEIDKIQIAKEMYHQMTKTHFQSDHCWNLLRHQPKWNTHMGQATSKRKPPDGTFNKTQDAINLDDDTISGSFSTDIERPIGRKAEKDRRKKGKTDHKDLMEIVAQLTIDKKKEHTERMVFAEVERVRVEKEWKDHLCIENEKLQVDKLRAETDSQRAEAERHRAEAERQRAFAKVEMVEQQKRDREFKIMMTDLSTLSEMQREYIKSLQSEILGKRHQ